MGYNGPMMVSVALAAYDAETERKSGASDRPRRSRKTFRI
jgi:hypothetical protein